nr:hypothetical protein [Abalone asfa-like virus]
MKITPIKIQFPEYNYNIQQEYIEVDGAPVQLPRKCQTIPEFIEKVEIAITKACNNKKKITIEKQDNPAINTETFYVFKNHTEEPIGIKFCSYIAQIMLFGSKIPGFAPKPKQMIIVEPESTTGVTKKLMFPCISFKFMCYRVTFGLWAGSPQFLVLPKGQKTKNVPYTYDDKFIKRQIEIDPRLGFRVCRLEGFCDKLEEWIPCSTGKYDIETYFYTEDGVIDFMSWSILSGIGPMPVHPGKIESK